MKKHIILIQFLRQSKISNGLKTCAFFVHFLVHETELIHESTHESTHESIGELIQESNFCLLLPEQQAPLNYGEAFKPNPKP